MNYGRLRDKVLQLLNQYTVVGGQIPDSYNTQIDYKLRIPELCNDAMMEISTTMMKIPEVIEADSLPHEHLGRLIRYELPDDFYQLKSGGVMVVDHCDYRHTNDYKLQGRKYILLPDHCRLYTLEYYRYPRLLKPSPADTDRLDNEEIVHSAIPYYVAAYLVAHDDAFLYATFYNQYADKLDKMSPGITAEVDQVNDVYEGVFSWGGDYT